MTTWEGRYTFRVSSADPDAETPVWVDFTDRVRDVAQTMEVATGRQNDLDDAPPAPFRVQLDNDDDELTFGNLSSSYAAWWGPGLKCQLIETVAGVEMYRYTGYLQTPTEVVVTATEDSAVVQQRVSVAALDRLGRLDSSEPFVSTLAAHIASFDGNATLVHYWPLVDAAAPFRPLVGDTAIAGTIVRSSTRPDGTLAALTPAGGSTQPGDDMPGLAFTVASTGSASSDSPVLTVGESGIGGGFIPPSGSLTDATPTVVLWVNPQLPFDEQVTLLTFHLRWGALSAATCVLSRLVSGSGGLIQLDVTGTVSGTVTTQIVLGTDRWYQLAVSVQPGTVSTSMLVWVDGRLFNGVGTGSGGAVPGVVCDYLTVGGKLQGTVKDLQIYTGSLTNDEIDEQRTVALLGLDRQTTGERIATVLGYAGVRPAEMRIDTGTTVMQRAALAGKTPLQAARDAERTEQGLLHVDGLGVTVFKDRRTLYNV